MDLNNRSASDLLIPSTAGEQRIWLRVGTMLDGAGGRPIHGAHVVYCQKEILFTGEAENYPPAELLNPGQSQPDRDLPDFTLLPGLIEAHAHLFLEGGQLDPAMRAAYLKQTPAALLREARSRLKRLVQLGVVAVRDAGDKDGVGLSLSKLYAGPDRPIMPYVDSAAAAIHHRGRYGSFLADPLENYSSPYACVEARVKAGADRIKLIPTGVIDFKTGAMAAEPQMTAEEIHEIAAAARSFGRQTLAHASGGIGIERTVSAGVDTVEHGFFIQNDHLAQMRDRQIAWVPTFSPVRKMLDCAGIMGWGAGVEAHVRRILEQHAKSLIKAYEMGVSIIAGSDAGSCGVPHGHGLLHELESMEQSGLPPLAVIHAATGNSSGRLAFKEKFGRIEAGYRSRFLLTRHAPLEGVSNLRKHRYVIFDGDVFENMGDSDSTGL